MLFFVMLAPWDWDNTKLMLWCYVLVLPAVGDALRSLPAPPRAGLHVLLFYSGALSVVSACSGQGAVPLLAVQEAASVCAALSGIPPGERVATAQVFNHPAALCGHALVAGYAGHLWSHGIDAKAVEERLTRLMKGEPGWAESARALRARYVYWGPRESTSYSDASPLWHEGVPVAEGAWGRLYALGR
jgi:hypothetical protein